MKINIPIAKVDLNKNEINSVLGPLKNGWLVQGPMVKEFEKKWSDFTKSNFLSQLPHAHLLYNYLFLP